MTQTLLSNWWMLTIIALTILGVRDLVRMLKDVPASPDWSMWHKDTMFMYLLDAQRGAIRYNKPTCGNYTFSSTKVGSADVYTKDTTVRACIDVLLAGAGVEHVCIVSLRVSRSKS